jgi:hypothetical protein
MRLVQGEPLLRLFVGVVVEFMVDLARAQGTEQLAPDILRELAGMDGDIGQGHKLQGMNTKIT